MGANPVLQCDLKVYLASNQAQDSLRSVINNCSGDWHKLLRYFEDSGLTPMKNVGNPTVQWIDDGRKLLLST